MRTHTSSRSARRTSPACSLLKTRSGPSRSRPSRPAWTLISRPNLREDRLYIHGTDVVVSLAEKPGNFGFILPDIAKNDLFRGVVFDGVLPRKTFSMGEAHEKRYYMEAKTIVKHRTIKGNTAQNFVGPESGGCRVPRQYFT